MNVLHIGNHADPLHNMWYAPFLSWLKVPEFHFDENSEQYNIY